MKSELFCNAKIYWYKVGAFSGWIVDNTMLQCKDFLIICNQSKIDTKFWILSGTWGFSTLHQTRFQCQVCLFWFCWWKNASKLSLNLQNRFRCSRYSLMLYCIPLITSLQSNYSLKWYFVMLFTWWLIVVWFSD